MNTHDFPTPPLQDSFGQQHVVEVLKEEMEHGRLASGFKLFSTMHTSQTVTLVFEKGTQIKTVIWFFPPQFGFTGRAGRQWMERHSSPVQGGSKTEENTCRVVFVTQGHWAPFTVLQKMLLRYYLFEGMRYVWLDRKGAFCRVRYWNWETLNICLAELSQTLFFFKTTKLSCPVLLNWHGLNTYDSGLVYT